MTQYAGKAGLSHVGVVIGGATDEGAKRSVTSSSAFVSRAVQSSTADQDPATEPATQSEPRQDPPQPAVSARAVGPVGEPCCWFCCAETSRLCLHSRVPCDRCAVRLALEAAE